MDNDTFSFLATKLDFKDIKASLAAYIKSKPEFANYDFDASTLNILTDILAFNTQQNAWLANMIANEMFLDTAVLRESVVSNSQAIGYTARSAKSAIGQVKVQFYPNDNPPVIFVAKGTEFTGKTSNNSNLRFTTKESYSVTKDENDEYIGYFDLVEGKRLQHKWTVSDSVNQFIIPNEGVDLSTLIVRVQDSASSNVIFYYSLAENITQVGPDDLVYYINETLDDTYQIKFGDGLVGKSVINGNIVIIDYVVSSGAAGNTATNFVPRQALSVYSGTRYTTTLKAASGADKESVDSIKTYAPRNFTTQNRAVTTNDFETLIKRYYPNAETISVWGGQDNVPPKYGKVFLAVKPLNGDSLNTTEVSDLKRNLYLHSVVSLQLEYVEPEIFDIVLSSFIKYDSGKTTTSEGALRTKLLATISAFSSANLNSFGSDFKFSNLTEEIDNTDVGINNNLSTILLKKRIYPNLNTFSSYEINFENAIKESNIAKKLHSVKSSAFVYKGQECTIEDDGSGKLYIFRNISNTKVIINDNIGSVDYSTGVLILENFAPEDVTGQIDGEEYIDFTMVPLSYDLSVSNNKILRISTDNVVLTIIDESR